MTLDLIIKGVKIVSAFNIKEGDIGISSGKIVKIGKISGKAKTGLLIFYLTLFYLFFYDSFYFPFIPPQIIIVFNIIKSSY